MERTDRRFGLIQWDDTRQTNILLVRVTETELAEIEVDIDAVQMEMSVVPGRLHMRQIRVISGAARFHGMVSG